MPKSRNRPRSELTRQGGAAGAVGDDLRGEIDMLRELMRRVMEQPLEEIRLEDLLKVLEGQGRAAARLAGLLKAQRELDETVGAGEALSRAFDEAIKEMGIQ